MILETQAARNLQSTTVSTVTVAQLPCKVSLVQECPLRWIPLHNICTIGFNDFSLAVPFSVWTTYLLLIVLPLSDPGRGDHSNSQKTEGGWYMDVYMTDFTQICFSPEQLVGLRIYGV